MPFSCLLRRAEWSHEADLVHYRVDQTPICLGQTFQNIFVDTPRFHKPELQKLTKYKNILHLLVVNRNIYRRNIWNNLMLLVIILFAVFVP